MILKFRRGLRTKQHQQQLPAKKRSPPTQGHQMSGLGECRLCHQWWTTSRWAGSSWWELQCSRMHRFPGPWSTQPSQASLHGRYWGPRRIPSLQSSAKKLKDNAKSANDLVSHTLTGISSVCRGTGARKGLVSAPGAGASILTDRKAGRATTAAGRLEGKVRGGSPRGVVGNWAENVVVCEFQG